MPLNPQTGAWEDDDGLMVPDWAADAPPTIVTPANPMPAPVDSGDYLTPVEGPDEWPGDRAPGALTPYDNEPLPGAPVMVAEELPLAPETPKLEPVSFTPTTVDDAETTNIPAPAGARTKVSQLVQSPEQKAVNADASKIADAQVAAERNAGALRQDALREQADLRAREAERAEEKKQNVDALMKDHEQRLAAAMAKRDSAEAEWKSSKIHDYWSDKTTGDRILAGLAVFMGGYAAGLLGTENSALKNLNANINRDYERQKAEIEKKHDVFLAMSKNVEQAKILKLEALTDLNTKFTAATEASAETLAEMKLRQGIPAEQVQTDKDVLAIREKANKFRDQATKDTNARVEWDTYNKARGGSGRVGGGGGGGGGKGGVSELVAMKEAGELDSVIAKRAEELRLRPKDYLPSLRAAAKNVPGGGGADGGGIGDIFGPGGAPIANLGNTKDGAKKAKDINEGNAAYRDLREALVEYKEMNGRGLTSNGIAGTYGEYQKRDSARGTIMALVKKADKLGTLDKGVEALVNREIGGTFDMATGSAANRVDKLLETIDRGNANLLDSVGLDGKKLQPTIRGDRGASAPAAESARPAAKDTARDAAPATSGPVKINHDALNALPADKRKNALEATAALRDPQKRAKADKYLRSLGVI